MTLRCFVCGDNVLLWSWIFVHTPSWRGRSQGERKTQSKLSSTRGRVAEKYDQSRQAPHILAIQSSKVCEMENAILNLNVAKTEYGEHEKQEEKIHTVCARQTELGSLALPSSGFVSCSIQFYRSELQRGLTRWTSITERTLYNFFSMLCTISI